MIAGSPFKQRTVRFDEQRLNDLRNIQGQVLNYWTQKAALPKALTDLQDPISGFMVPADPENGSAYEYGVTGKLSFKLCATFGLSSKDAQVGSQGAMRSVPVTPYGPYGAIGMGDNWDHGAGNQCFARTIDPQLYPTKAIPAK